MRALVVAAVTAVTLAGTAVGIRCLVPPAESGPDDDSSSHLTVEEGQVCRTDLDPVYELSCGTAAFGDVRYNCTEVELGRCPETNSVTVRNVGRTRVRISVISGSKQGERNLATAAVLPVGASVELRPRDGDRYLYDICMQPASRGTSAIQLVDIS
ncbi:hypothetical protein ACWGI8_28700 [Streptomyces sp. NPDC054841]